MAEAARAEIKREAVNTVRFMRVFFQVSGPERTPTSTSEMRRDPDPNPVTSTDGAARARQVLRLPGQAGITVAGQRRNLTGLPLDVEHVRFS